MEQRDLLEKLAFVQFKTQSDYLAEKIKNMIINDEFSDGYIFPNENDFCKILNVSRGTLRDAYKKLATQGFIERTKQGTFVKCKEKIALQGNFSASLELAEKQEMTEFICAFEPEAVYLAVQKISDEQIDELEMLMNECEQCADDNEALNEANYKFHEFIRINSKNNLVISMLTAYYDIFNKQIVDAIYYLLNEGTDDFKNAALLQHRELVSAFRERDGEKARKNAHDHLEADLRMYAQIEK